MDAPAADGGRDWNAGVLACMSAKHEKALGDLRTVRFDAAEATALQAGRTAFQSHPPCATNDEPPKLHETRTRTALQIRTLFT